VRAVNVVGSGAASADLCATAKVVPDAPSISSITTRDRSASVAFSLGANGGAAITDIEYSTDNGSTWQSSGRTTSPLQISGLTNGTTYTIRLRAKNSVGVSTESSATSATVTPANVPNAPSISSIVEGNAQLTVTFSPPTSDGGESITGYQYSTDGGSTWTTKSTTGTTTRVMVIEDLSTNGTTDLTNGTSYSVAVRAVSNAGNGLTSSLLDVMPSTTPGTPTSVTAVGYNTRLLVSYTAPTSTGGKSILRYEYALATSSDGTTYGSFGSWTSANTAGTSFTLTGLTNGTYYSVKIRAVNENGEGTATTEVASSPRPLAVPESPVITRILSSANDSTLSTTQLSVAFTEPANNGSSISSYEYSTDDGATWKARADGSGRLSPLVISTVSGGSSSLVAGTSYVIRIRAVNANGSGPASESSTGSPASDTTAPTVTLGVTSSSATSASISFTVTGNEAISCSTLSTVAGEDFNPTNIASIDSITQTSSTVCTINVTSTAVSGGATVTSTLTAASSFSMTDTASPGNIQTTLTGSPKSISVTVAPPPDTTAPTVSSLSFTSSAGSDDTYKTGDVVSVTVVFSEAVTITGSPRILISGLTSKYLTYASGTGTTSIVFSYTIAAGDTDTDGLAVGANALALNSGTIKDSSNNAATITHSAISANSAHKVDTTAPTATLSVSSSTASTASISFTVTGSEEITCSTLSTVSGTDFTYTGISSIDLITQTSTTVCTISATSTAVAGGGPVSSILTAAASFSITDVAGNAQTTLTGSPKTITVTVTGSGAGSSGSQIASGTTTSTSTSTTSTTTTVVVSATTSTSSSTIFIQPRRSTTTTSTIPRRSTTTTTRSRQQSTTTTVVERQIGRVQPIIVTTTTIRATTTTLRIQSTTTVAVRASSTTVNASTSTAVASTSISVQSTISSTPQVSTVKPLPQSEVESAIGKSSSNVWDLSLPVYVDNVLPKATPTQPVAIQSGAPSPVDVAVINEQAVQLEMGDGFTVRVTALDGQGNVAPLAPNGAVRATRSNAIYVTGEGLKPGSQAVVWIFSTPRRLGVIQVGSEGKYSSRLSVSPEVELGEHTLQVNGVVLDGNVRSMNIALEILDSEPKPTQSDDSGPTASVALLGSLMLIILGGGVIIYNANRRRNQKSSQ